MGQVPAREANAASLRQRPDDRCGHRHGQNARLPRDQAYVGRRTAEGEPSVRSNAASSEAIARDTRCAAARTEGVRLGLEPISEADLAPVDRLMTMLGAGLHRRCSCAGGAGRRTSRDTGPWRRLGDCLSWCA